MTRPKTTRAAILVETGKSLVLDEVALPESLDCGQVLVRVFYSTICGSQLGEIDAVKGPDKYLPHLLGHEGSGEIIETGPGVRHVRPGDRVVLHWRKGKGIDAVPAAYSWKGSRLNAGCVTTFSDFTVVSENRLTVLPPDFNLEVAPLFGCAVTTGFGALINKARLSIGESVVVFGAGGVGLNVIQGAQLTSAHPVVAVDLFDNRLDLARRLGATHVFNARGRDVRADILAVVGAQGADVVVDNTGNPSVIAQAYSLAKADGRVILVGVPRAGQDVTLYSLPLHFGKVLTGTHGGDGDPAKDIPRYAGLYTAGILKLDELITERLPLEEINTAITRMRSGEVSGRCLLAMR